MNHHQGNLHTYMHTGAKRNIYLICVWTRHGIDWDQRDRNTLTCIYIHIIFQRLTPLRLSAPTLSRGCSTDGSLTFVHAPLALPAEHSLGARGRSVDTPPTLLGRFADVPWALPRSLDAPETPPRRSRRRPPEKLLARPSGRETQSSHDPRRKTPDTIELASERLLPSAVPFRKIHISSLRGARAAFGPPPGGRASPHPHQVRMRKKTTLGTTGDEEKRNKF